MLFTVHDALAAHTRLGVTGGPLTEPVEWVLIGEPAQVHTYSPRRSRCHLSGAWFDQGQVVRRATAQVAADRTACPCVRNPSFFDDELREHTTRLRTLATFDGLLTGLELNPQPARWRVWAQALRALGIAVDDPDPALTDVIRTATRRAVRFDREHIPRWRAGNARPESVRRWAATVVLSEQPLGPATPRTICYTHLVGDDLGGPAARPQWLHELDTRGARTPGGRGQYMLQAPSNLSNKSRDLLITAIAQYAIAVAGRSPGLGLLAECNRYVAVLDDVPAVVAEVLRDAVDTLVLWAPNVTDGNVHTALSTQCAETFVSLWDIHQDPAEVYDLARLV